MPTTTISTTTLHRNGTAATVALIAYADGSHGVHVALGDDTHESLFPALAPDTRVPPGCSVTAGVFYDAAVGALYRLGWR